MSLELRERLNDCLRDTVISMDDDPSWPSLRWEVPKDVSFGDLSSPVAFKLAARKKKPPQNVSQELSGLIEKKLQDLGLSDWVERVEAKNGFVNLILSQDALARIASSVNRLGGNYGNGNLGKGKKVLVEFVSANPTGPLSVAHGRQAAVGDALSRILRSQSYKVMCEYYLNDEGRQIDLLGESLRVRYLEHLGEQVAFPQDGYRGDYIKDCAKGLFQDYGHGLKERALQWFIDYGMEAQFLVIKKELSRFGLEFDKWSSQKHIRTSGMVDRALDVLRQGKVLYDSEGATWFASTQFGDDKDRVVLKKSGELTYLAPDIAYHKWKFDRGYDLLINLWGPDHHGYIGRIKAAVKALGLSDEKLIIRIVQLVTLSRHGKVVPMSKREGEFVTFREILDEVGVDATRFFYLMRTMESHLDFDLDLAKSQSQENPVYYIQYAHARICSIIGYSKKALGVKRFFMRPDLSLLSSEEERLVMRQIFLFPMVLAGCSAILEPHGLTVYLQKLAELFHVFYTKHRVVSEDVRLSRARIELVKAARQVIARGLSLLGVSAPVRM